MPTSDPKSPSDQIFEMVLTKIFESAKEYRALAREFLKKADELEAQTLRIVMEAKQREEESLREAMAEAARK